MIEKIENYWWPDGQFPPHWIHFVEHVQNTPINRIVDVGCGAGAYCHISTQMGIEYIGYDYSQHAIDLATKTWGGNFICKNYKELTPQDIQTGDIVVANALCDVLPNGDECLRSLLQIGADNLLIQRIRTTNIPIVMFYQLVTLSHSFQNCLGFFFVFQIF